MTVDHELQPISVAFGSLKRSGARGGLGCSSGAGAWSREVGGAGQNRKFQPAWSCKVRDFEGRPKEAAWKCFKSSESGAFLLNPPGPLRRDESQPFSLDCSTVIFSAGTVHACSPSAFAVCPSCRLGISGITLCSALPLRWLLGLHRQLSRLGAARRFISLPLAPEYWN